MFRNYQTTLVCSLLSATASATLTWFVVRETAHSARKEEADKFINSFKVGAPEKLNPRTSPIKSSAPNVSQFRSSTERLTIKRTTDPSNPLGAAISTVESTGDFSQLLLVFDSLSQNDRIGRFLEIPAVFSKLGPKHDIAEKLALLEKVNAPASTLETFKRKILEMEARERYGAMKEEGVLANLKDEEFGSVCRALAMSRMKQGFQCIEDGASENAKRTAASMVGQFAIQAGTMEASKEISALPPGIVRDEAVAEMVLWLKKTGSEKEAAPWLETIQDEKAKARAMGK